MFKNEPKPKESLVFLSRCLTEEKIKNRDYKTSSEYYEGELIRSLSTLIPIALISTAKNSIKERKVEEINIEENIKIHKSKKNIISILKAIKNNSKQNPQKKDLTILTTGYYPHEMILLLWMSITRKAKIYSIIYDTHKTSIARLPKIKKTFANLYFEIGFFLARKLTGIIILNEAFIKTRKISIPYHITKIGHSINKNHSTLNFDKNSNFKILFIGTINQDNGIDLALEIPKLCKNTSITILGSGPDNEKVFSASQKNPQIIPKERIGDKDLDNELKNHDLLLCLRDPESASNEYAFPSKLIKLLSSGKRVLCSDFPGLPLDLKKHLIILDEFSNIAIKRTIEEVIANPNMTSYSKEQVDHLLINYDWKQISSKMLSFIKNPYRD